MAIVEENLFLKHLWSIVNRALAEKGQNLALSLQPW